MRDILEALVPASPGPCSGVQAMIIAMSVCNLVPCSHPSLYVPTKLRKTRVCIRIQTHSSWAVASRFGDREPDFVQSFFGDSVAAQTGEVRYPSNSASEGLLPFTSIASIFSLLSSSTLLVPTSIRSYVFRKKPYSEAPGRGSGYVRADCHIEYSYVVVISDGDYSQLIPYLPQSIRSSATRSTTSGKAEIVFGTAKAILAILREVGEMTQNIPYIKAVSGVCIQILQMKAEVDGFRENWKAVMKNIEEINEIIEEYYTELASTGMMVIPDDVKKAFKSLEQYLQATVATWARYQPRTKSDSTIDRISLYLRRIKLNTAIKNCARDTEIALQIFNASKVEYRHPYRHHEDFGRAEQSKAVSEFFVHASLIEMQVRIVPIEDTVTSPDLRAPSGTMFGREHEIQEVITSIQQRAPARITILGPGGIGKTSLALAVLHHPAIASEFIDARYFVPCDAAWSVNALLLELATALGIFTDGLLSVEKKILVFLRSSKCIVCLDNFETPWDAQTQLVEELLAKITSIPSVTVLVTMRGTEQPAKTLWTQPFMSPVMPLTLEAALQTFEAISGKRDTYATKLVQAVECVPLAVHLLAYLAQSEGDYSCLGALGDQTYIYGSA
ncbi:hypothetical protein EVG20_g8758 [Dentipellis fragilis]|uniref:NB-ARC domain-containing protein n=1 Tax=Dentipellis fragilis TaxID=205917 RepID=A0A4Y9Y428_9AGAM|nr:hypothetical protein EVG20_g8758 [Dentipellis fragilis]